MAVEESLVDIRISPDQTDAFVEKLVRDEEFRRALEQRPAETLADYDISISPDLLVERVKLPAPEEIEQARATMDAGEFTPEWMSSKEFRFITIFRRFKILIFRR